MAPGSRHVNRYRSAQALSGHSWAVEGRPRSAAPRPGRPHGTEHVHGATTLPRYLAEHSRPSILAPTSVASSTRSPTWRRLRRRRYARSSGGARRGPSVYPVDGQVRVLFLSWWPPEARGAVISGLSSGTYWCMVTVVTGMYKSLQPEPQQLGQGPRGRPTGLDIPR